MDNQEQGRTRPGRGQETYRKDLVPGGAGFFDPDKDAPRPKFDAQDEQIPTPATAARNQRKKRTAEFSFIDECASRQSESTENTRVPSHNQREMSTKTLSLCLHCVYDCLTRHLEIDISGSSIQATSNCDNAANTCGA